jgi:hypothetical protein
MLYHGWAIIWPATLSGTAGLGMRVWKSIRIVFTISVMARLETAEVLFD